MLETGRDRGVSVLFDMEQRGVQPLTLELSRRCVSLIEGCFGVALQAYLRSAESDARALGEWAQRERKLITARLCTGPGGSTGAALVADPRVARAAITPANQPNVKQLVCRLVQATRAWRLGDSRDPATDLGPMIDAPARDRLLATLQAVLSEPGTPSRLELVVWPAAGGAACAHL